MGPRIAPEAKLFLQVIRANGKVEDYGLVSRRCVTTAGVNALVDAFQGSFTLSDFKYHASGTGTNAEAVGDTALQTEATAITDRATGSQTEGASANIYKTVGTQSYTGSGAITEHGIFSSATEGAGTLWDRSVFSAINVANGDSINLGGALA